MKIKGGPLSGKIEAPPSKSYTHRAIIAASLAEGVSEIRKPLLAEDTRATINAARMFGAEISLSERGLLIRGETKPRAPDDVINAQNSGTTMRLMTSVAGLVKSGYTILTGDSSLRKRPMQPLLDALNMLGVKCWSARLDGCAPVIVEGGGGMGGICAIRGDLSSQFISGLLIAAPNAEEEVTIDVEGEIVSRPYIEATIDVQRRFGAHVVCNPNSFNVYPKHYRASSLTIPGDYGLAAFMMAAPYLAGGEVTVTGLGEEYVQADREIVRIISEMGGDIREGNGGVSVKHSRLQGIKVSLKDAPDLLPVVACLACVAKGRTEIRGVWHARFKESDRISALKEELEKLGTNVVELRDGLIIEPSELKSTTLDPRGDHRLFMCFATIALGVRGGLTVLNPDLINVSNPSFLRDLSALGAEVEAI